MASLKIVFAFGLIAFAAAHPMMGGGEHMDPFTQLKSILNDEQQQQLKAIWENDALTKQQVQDQIKAYFENLGGEALVS